MRDPLLLTPGPLTTTLSTKAAMLRDWGSWDADFNALTARVCRRLVDIVHGADAFTCVPLQGSGTFAVEAAVAALVPREGGLLVLANGAYGQRMARLATVIGRRVRVIDFGETQPVDPQRVAEVLATDTSLTHVGVIHCETSTGILNPIEAIAQVVAQAGRSLLIDAMSSFGALPLDTRSLPVDAIVASSNKCLEGVPGMGFVVIRTACLESAEGRAHSLSLDLHDQWRYLQRTGQWRFTPPTHVVAALAQALSQYDEQGGQPARLARYEANAHALLSGLRARGLQPFLPPAWQAPIIVTVHAPEHPAWQFQRFYEAVKARGIVLYPGKLTAQETFRVGCIGDLRPADLEHALDAMVHALQDMGLPWPLPAPQAACPPAVAPLAEPLPLSMTASTTASTPAL